MQKIDWETFERRVREEEATVTFKKANGEVRIMACTLASYLLPETYQEREPTPEVVVVFDLEKNGWRSFRKDTVIQITYPLDEEE